MMHAHVRHQGQGWQLAQWWKMEVERREDGIKETEDTEDQDS